VLFFVAKGAQVIAEFNYPEVKTLLKSTLMAKRIELMQ